VVRYKLGLAPVINDGARGGHSDLANPCATSGSHGGSGSGVITAAAVGPAVFAGVPAFTRWVTSQAPRAT